MMEDRPGVDGIKLAAKRSYLEQIGLGVCDAGYPRLLRLAPSVSETVQAKIYREHLHVLEGLRDFDRMLAGAAARNQ